MLKEEELKGFPINIRTKKALMRKSHRIYGDHSMLTAIKTVENIKNNNFDKTAVWDINAEQDYHEEKQES